MFRGKTRDEWCAVFEGSDACFAPVLNFAQARAHPHHQARQRSVNVAGIDQPAPAPLFDRTPGVVRGGPPGRGVGGREALVDWGCTPAEIERLAALGLGVAG